LKLFDQALASYDRAITIKPDAAALHFNRANVLSELNRLEDALSGYDSAIRYDRNMASAHLNRGNVLGRLERLEDAVDSYDKALALQPAIAEAHNNRGAALQDMDRVDEALVSFERALALKPDYVEALCNRGSVLKSLCLYLDALASYDAAIAINPKSAKAFTGRCNVLVDLGRADAALADAERAIELNSDYAEGYDGRGNALARLGRSNDALAQYNQAIKRDPSLLSAHLGKALVLDYLAMGDNREIFELTSTSMKKIAEKITKRTRRFLNSRESERRLRIGYVSGDFNGHPVAVFLQPLLAHHDRHAVEIVCYSTSRNIDEVTERLRSHADKWRSVVADNDITVADAIEKDRIDILIDLSGHTIGNRLGTFARKPAPVQITWLGYPNTTGVAEIDYRMTDALADPVGLADEHHSEKLLRLPQGFLCYLAPEEAPDPAPPPMLAVGTPVFGSFNNIQKLSPSTVTLWARLLRRVPQARLLLKGVAVLNADTAAWIRRSFRAEGIDPARLDLVEPVSGQTAHLAAYGRVDIALDPFPYNGTTTTFEALWMGVPVVALAGERHAARVGLDILTRLGLPELVASDQDTYIEIAAGLAADPRRLAELRRTLRERLKTSPWMDGPRFARDVEAAYRKVWHSWCANAKPDA
jgi:predicted O-linked N-acetylglucosamine transferase (SPINDLY family)